MIAEDILEWTPQCSTDKWYRRDELSNIACRNFEDCSEG